MKNIGIIFFCILGPILLLLIEILEGILVVTVMFIFAFASFLIRCIEYPLIARIEHKITGKWPAFLSSS